MASWSFSSQARHRYCSMIWCNRCHKDQCGNVKKTILLVLGCRWWVFSPFDHGRAPLNLTSCTLNLPGSMGPEKRARRPWNERFLKPLGPRLNLFLSF